MAADRIAPFNYNERDTTKRKRLSPESSHYVDNKRFWRDIVEYHEQIAQSATPEKVQIPKYCGLAIMLIAQRLALRPNFSGYSFVDEMIGDAIENCIKAFNSFDPNKTNNPFGYFTQVCKFAFIRRINLEAKQRDIVEAIKESQTAFTDLTDVAEGDHQSYASNAVHQAQQDFYRSRKAGEIAREEKRRAAREKRARKRKEAKEKHKPQNTLPIVFEQWGSHRRKVARKRKQEREPQNMKPNSGKQKARK